MKRRLHFFSAVGLGVWLHAASALAATDPVPLAAARALFNEPAKSAQARQAYEKIAAADPANAEAQDGLAQLALRRGEADDALAHAEKAVALAPNDAGIQHTLGDAYGRSAAKASVFSQFGLAKKCLAAYERAVALAPGNAGYRQDLFEFYRNAPALMGGGADKALAEAAAIKKLDPLRGHLAFATLYAADKKFDDALAELDAALRTAPENYAALYQIGKLAVLSGQFLDRGLASLRRCLELAPGENDPPHPAADWRIGNLLEKKSDPAGARAAYEAALKLDPKYTAAIDALKKLK